MGYGHYSYEAHVALTQSRAGQGASQVFRGGTVHPSMHPRGVVARESRDSADNPNSLGIVFALDISGSMSDIPVQIATTQLPGFMKLLTDCQVASPQVLFMALTDVQGDGCPLQVGQFETTAELMDAWLTRCSLRGGGDELYELALHFCARHTAMDCVEKRGKKGYLFVTGDEPVNEVLRKELVKTWIGTDVQDMTFAEVVEDVSRSFHVFYLVPDHARSKQIGPLWEKALGKQVVVLDSPIDTCAAAAAIVALSEGAVSGLDELSSRLVAAGVEGERARGVCSALRPWAKSIGRG